MPKYSLWAPLTFADAIIAAVLLWCGAYILVVALMTLVRP
jgi:hypothetical protein